MIKRAKRRFVEIDEDKEGVAEARAAIHATFGSDYCVIPTSLVTNALAMVGSAHFRLEKGGLGHDTIELLLLFVGKVLKSAAEGAGVTLEELAKICGEICND